MHFEIYKDSTSLLSLEKGQWRWRLRATNGEIIAHGESYHNKKDCQHVIDLIKNTSLGTPVQEV